MEKLYSIKESTLKSIADSIRNVSGSADNIPTAEMAVEIIEGAENAAQLPKLTNEADASDLLINKELIGSDRNKVTGTFTIDSELNTQDDLIAQIQTALAGKASATPTLQEKTATPTTSSQTITPDSNYDGLSKVTVNAMPTATQATPSISVNSSGLITASATQTAGYVSAGTKSATKQLTVQAAKTITPSTSSQTAVASGVYTTGAVTVAGDANLVAENIAEGVSIFGVTGAHSGGSSGGGSVETCDCLFTCNCPAMDDVTVYYVNANMEVATKSFSVMDGTSITVVKNTIVTVVPWTSMTSASGSCSQLIASAVGGSFIINDDSTITYEG